MSYQATMTMSEWKFDWSRTGGWVTGLDELGEGSKEVVSKIGEFGGDIGSELLGDRGGEVLFGGGKGGDLVEMTIEDFEEMFIREVVIEMDKDDVYIEEFWERHGFGVKKF
ncbi:hypothetical protein Tco_0418271 [Tanacetum coccineum]